MKKFIVFALVLAFAPAAFAQLYKYVDKDGKTVYSDSPPPNIDSKQLNIQTGTSSAPPKSAVERDKELQKGREDQAKKEAEAAKVAGQKEIACERARRNMAAYAAGGRMQRTNEKGEREYLSDDEIVTETQKAQKQVDEACAK